MAETDKDDLIAILDEEEGDLEEIPTTLPLMPVNTHHPSAHAGSGCCHIHGYAAPVVYRS